MSDLSISFNVNAAATAELPEADIHARISLDDLLFPNPDKTLIVRCTDELLAAQGFHRGDLLVIDQSQSPRTGQRVNKIINDEISVH